MKQPAPETPDGPERRSGDGHRGHTLVYGQNGLYCRTCDELLASKYNPRTGRAE